MRGANANRVVSVLLYNEDCYLQSEVKPIANISYKTIKSCLVTTILDLFGSFGDKSS
jgi:hypothetical protein